MLHGIALIKQSHQYFYQIQAQIGICAATYADLVVWTTKDCLVTRIRPSHNFVMEVIQKVNEMYCCSILPELLGKYWSKQNIMVEDVYHSLELRTHLFGVTADLDDDEVGSGLIGCDNYLCQVKWFHTACLQLDIVPRGKWYCPDCKPHFNSIEKSQKLK